MFIYHSLGMPGQNTSHHFTVSLMKADGGSAPRLTFENYSIFIKLPHRVKLQTSWDKNSKKTDEKLQI